MLRPVLALERLTFLEPEGKVGYGYAEKGAEQETMDYLEFIARVTSHIPDKGQVMVRYYGLYANAHIYRSPEASVCGGEAPTVPCFCAGCAHGGRGERGILISFRDRGGAGVYCFFSRCGEFFSQYALRVRFSRYLTAPPGRRYTSTMDRGEFTAPQEKETLILALEKNLFSASGHC